jgi:ATP phosphoribosyltransferase
MSERLRRAPAEPASRPLTLAVPKGRVLHQLAPVLEAHGVDTRDVLAEDRRLVRRDPRTGLAFLLLKPDDVPTYVEYGTADAGVVGRDVLLEREYDLYQPLDLGIGRCRMVVAGFADRAMPRERTLRVATKFGNVARRHFASKGVPVEIIYVQGSVETAPIVGLSDVIVDLVESGETLRQNGLAVLEPIVDISSVVVVNRLSYKLHEPAVRGLLDALAATARPTPAPRGKRGNGRRERVA